MREIIKEIDKIIELVTPGCINQSFEIKARNEGYIQGLRRAKELLNM